MAADKMPEMRDTVNIGLGPVETPRKKKYTVKFDFANNESHTAHKVSEDGLGTVLNGFVFDDNDVRLTIEKEP